MKRLECIGLVAYATMAAVVFAGSAAEKQADMKNAWVKDPHSAHRRAHFGAGSGLRLRGGLVALRRHAQEA